MRCFLFGWQLIFLFFMLGSLSSCKVHKKGPPQKASPRVSREKGLVEDELTSSRQEPTVKKVRVIYQELEGVSIPTLFIDFETEDTFVEYTACAISSKECIKGESHVDLHGMLSLPKGEVSIEYRPCYYNREERTSKKCGTKETVTTVNTPVKTSNPELEKVLIEQSEIELTMMDHAKKIKVIAANLKNSFDSCDNQELLESFDKKQKKLIVTLASMSIEEIRDLLMSGGDLIERLVEMEEDRQDKKEADLKKEAALKRTKFILMGQIILLGGSALGLYASIKNISQWSRYNNQQLTIYDKAEQEAKLIKAENGKYKLDGSKLGTISCEDCRFIQDPYTKHIYQVEGNPLQEIRTMNGHEIKNISGNVRIEKGHLVKEGKSYHIERENGFFKLDGGKLQIAKIPGTQMEIEVPNRRGFMEQLSSLGKQPGAQAIATQKIQKDLNKQMAATSPKMRGLLLPAVGLTMSTIFAYGNWETISGASASLSGQTKGPCEMIGSLIKDLKVVFDQAESIYEKLLEVKIRIGLLT